MEHIEAIRKAYIIHFHCHVKLISLNLSLPLSVGAIVLDFSAGAGVSSVLPTSTAYWLFIGTYFRPRSAATSLSYIISPLLYFHSLLSPLDFTFCLFEVLRSNFSTIKAFLAMNMMG
jgi:hypothetical protein